jgi:segregation and condensation protein B
MELSHIIPHIEALIFASDKPLINTELVELLNTALGFIEDRTTVEQVDAAIEGIYEKYNSPFYAFELKQSGGGWQFLTKKEYHTTVAQLNGDKFLKRLSTAALETLAIIAYKQPVTKSEMEAIRGVNCDYAVQKLLEKDLVVITGRNEDAVGKPLIYGTSKSFMDYFGINSAADLPKINEVLMEELVQATVVNESTETLEFSVDNSEPEQTSVENQQGGDEEQIIAINEDEPVVFEEEESNTLRELIIEAYKQNEEAVLSVSGDVDDEGEKQKGGTDEQSAS